MEYRYHALALTKREVGETDRIYTFLTQEAGKISVLAKGVRKSEAKLASALEAGSEVELTVVRTRGMGKIAGALLEQAHPWLRGDFETLRLVMSALHTLDRLVDLEEKDEQTYLLLAQYLAVMDALARKGRLDRCFLVDHGFFFQLVFHLGYALQTHYCAVSGEPLASEQRYLLSPSAGGVVSLAHAARVSDGIVVGREIVKILRLFEHVSLERLTRIVVGDQVLAELARFRTVFFAWIRR